LKSLYKAKPATGAKWLVVLGLPLIAFGAYYGQGLSTHGDNLLHLYRLVALDKNIVQGAFFPRWTAELFLGFGYPLLNFYASSTYYLAELLHLLGAGYEQALIYTLLLLLVCASIGIYRLASDIFTDLGVDSPAPALLATAAYTFAPYLLFNLHVRGAIAELGAQALLPWVLWSFRRLICSEQPAKYLIWATFSLAALALTHTVSILLFVPILIAYALILLWRYRNFPLQLKQRLLWFVLAAASAAGVSAFFWLPVLVERQFLSTQAQEMSFLQLPNHTWTWQTFLDRNWLFFYNDAGPPRLGMVQLLLATGGLILIRKWSVEWVAIAVLAFLSCLLIGNAAVPLWRSHPLLLTVQFPWRLLGIASLPIALLTGGLLTRGPWRLLQALGLVLTIAIIIFANYPRIKWVERLQLDPAQINLTSISQYEAVTKRYGLSAATFREFVPRWVEKVDLERLPPAQTETPLSITLEDANAQRLQFNVTAPRPSQLTFTTFFFPGWQITLDDGQRLEPYSSPDFGLLTVDLPSGEHRLSLEWEQTSVQRWGSLASLLTLLLLGIFCLSRPHLRASALYPFAPLLMLVGLSIAASRLTPTYRQTPDQPAIENLQLLGYYTYQESADALYIFPHWYVEKAPTDLTIQWQLLDQARNPIATTRSFPHFNTLRSFQWSANMLVDDAYYLPLPPGLASGTYTLTMSVSPANTEATADTPLARPIGQVQIANEVPPLPALDHPLDIHFHAPGATEEGNEITLRGYTVASESPSGTKSQPEAIEEILAVAPGDEVIYTLYWQSEQAVPDRIQVFNQLLDHNRQTLTQINQPLQLSQGAPYYLWNPYWRRENHYRLQIPEDAAGGIYQPYVGIYQLDSGERFLATEANGTPIGDAVFLPPIKVARRAATPLANSVSARFGDVIRLEGYEMELPSEGLHAQSTLKVTLQYKSLSPTPIDYTQFIHLFDAELGMAAQIDTPPQGNGNPTSTWIPGEVIVDVIPLQIPEGAQAGRYSLSLGLYDPMAGGARLPVSSQDDQLLPDNQFILGEVEIQ
jgi:hypothetical protein